jgi:hypothetical protein
MSALAVGSTLWEFDDNRRKYDANRRLIFREHFVPQTIQGETRYSWLVGPARVKVRKADLTYTYWSGGRRRMYATEQEVEDVCWDKAHRYRVADMVRRVDAATLRRVAEVMGYSPEREEAEGT